MVKSIKIDRTILVMGIVAYLYSHGILVGFFNVLWAWGVHGAMFNIFSQISHVNELSMDHTETYRLKTGLAKNEWAAHQLLTAVDYSTNSWFWRTLSINLNAQIIHHLLPSVHPTHYPALREVLIPVAAKHGIDYKGRSSKTFPEMLKGYFTWINALNEKTTKSGVAKAVGVSDSTLWGSFIGSIFSTMAL